MSHVVVLPGDMGSASATSLDLPKPTTIHADFSHRLHAGSRQARDSRESIKPRIKAQDSLDSMVFHDGQMHSITRRHFLMPHDNFLCALGCGQINGQHLVGNTEQGVERRLDGVPTIDSDVAVQYLLQDLGIRNQALSIANQLFEQSLRVGLVRMRRANEIHRNVRIDQNHGWVPTPYPLSISAKMRTIAPSIKCENSCTEV